MNNLPNIFTKLWDAYSIKNPAVQIIYNSFINAGETVLNDHVAFRTFNHPRIDIKVMAKPFLDNGYIPIENYVFEDKKLLATHYEIPNKPEMPRVFISELVLESFSTEFQNLITDLINSVSNEIYESDSLILKGSIWPNPSYTIYNRLREESEYAAWLYVFGFCANHFTVSINSLKTLNHIKKVNKHLKNQGFMLNISGGEIKGSEKDLLQQSSTIAEKIPIKFIEGVYKIPGCYYEFAQRFYDTNGKLFSGFIAKSADKIFESTNFYNE